MLGLFTLAFLASAVTYYIHYRDVLLEAEAEQAVYINKHIFNDLIAQLEDHEKLVKGLNSDGDISAAYDDIPWLAFMGKQYAEKKLIEYLRGYPYLHNVEFLRNEEVIISVTPKKHMEEESIAWEQTLPLDFTHAQVRYRTDIISFIRDHLKSNNMPSNIGICFISPDGCWVISKNSIRECTNEKGVLLDNGTTLSEVYVTSPPLKSDSWSVQGLVSHQRMNNAMHTMLVKALVVYTISTILILIIARYISYILLRPLERLKEASHRIIDGDYSPIPVVAKDETKSSLEAFNTMGARIKGFTDELKDKIAERTSELEQKNRELEKMATTDSLTSLSNRRVIENAVKNESLRFGRYSKVFSILLIDIDLFKSVNDEYGHNIGDEVLMVIADILKSNMRSADMVGRWGGEEFLVLCPETDEKGAYHLAENLRKIVEDYTFPAIGTKTISIGIASCLPDENVEKLIARADEALYRAKAKGRNRSELWA